MKDFKSFMEAFGSIDINLYYDNSLLNELFNIYYNNNFEYNKKVYYNIVNILDENNYDIDYDKLINEYYFKQVELIKTYYKNTYDYDIDDDECQKIYTILNDLI